MAWELGGGPLSGGFLYHLILGLKLLNSTKKVWTRRERERKKGKKGEIGKAPLNYKRLKKSIVDLNKDFHLYSRFLIILILLWTEDER